MTPPTSTTAEPEGSSLFSSGGLSVASVYRCAGSSHEQVLANQGFMNSSNGSMVGVEGLKLGCWNCAWRRGMECIHHGHGTLCIRPLRFGPPPTTQHVCCRYRRSSKGWAAESRARGVRSSPGLCPIVALQTPRNEATVLRLTSHRSRWQWPAPGMRGRSGRLDRTGILSSPVR